MEYIIGFVAGAILTFLVITYYQHKMNEQFLNTTIEALETLKEKVVLAKIEVENNKLFMYDRDNGTFLADGITMDEVEEKLKSSFPSKYFDVSQEEIDNARAISILNTKLSEEKEDNGKTSVTSNT